MCPVTSRAFSISSEMPDELSGLVELSDRVGVTGASGLMDHAKSFFSQAVEESLAASDMFRITTTSFMDVYNFDIRQLMKSCVHHLLPSGHLIPFDAYNVLYRPGHIPLPVLSNSPELTELK